MSDTLQSANLWRRLPETRPFVLPVDADAIERFNWKAKEHVKVDLNLLPEPFIGRFDAPIVLLNLNPGWSSDDARWHRSPGFSRRLWANLKQERSPYPFYLLNPSQKQDFGEYSPGGKWWHNRLRVLIEHVGSLEAVARGLLCVEFFAYHSKRFGRRIQPIPSQEFSFSLVRSALSRKAIVVILRSRRLWMEAVPELLTYKRQFTLRNPRSTYLTPNNCDGFDTIVRRLKQADNSA